MQATFDTIVTKKDRRAAVLSEESKKYVKVCKGLKPN